MRVQSVNSDHAHGHRHSLMRPGTRTSSLSRTSKWAKYERPEHTIVRPWQLSTLRVDDAIAACGSIRELSRRSGVYRPGIRRWAEFVPLRYIERVEQALRAGPPVKGWHLAAKRGFVKQTPEEARRRHVIRVRLYKERKKCAMTSP